LDGVAVVGGTEFRVWLASGIFDEDGFVAVGFDVDGLDAD
jgi:hypothetical protein